MMVDGASAGNTWSKNKPEGAFMGVNEYAEQIVCNFIHAITDHVFLSIEQDDDVMREYMTNVNRYGLDAVNMAIGLKIKEALNLENNGENTSPKSRLIKKYTFHKK
jgi:spore maturation protein SpmA